MISADELRANIAGHDAWAVKALVAIYGQQTEAEKEAEEDVGERNGRGFTPFDTTGLTQLAKRYERGGKFSRAELDYLRRAMPKYARQLRRLMAERRLDAVHADIDRVLGAISASRKIRQKEALQAELAEHFASFDALQTIAIKG